MFKLERVHGVTKPCTQYEVNNLSKCKLTGPDYAIMATIEGYSVNCLIDTGAAASCINSDFVKRKLSNCEIRPVSDFGESDLSFVTASGEKLNYDGYISANITLPG